jgi:predicted MFS family arabinose efflux permease
MVPALMGLTTPETRSNAYALNSVGRGVGTFVGALVGGLLPGLFAGLFGDALDDPAPYRWSLWASAAFGLVALLPLLRLGHIENKSATTTGAESGPFPLAWVAVLIVYSFLTHGAFATCQSFCNAYMDEGLGLSPAAIGLIAGGGQFVAMLAPLLVPGIVRRYGNGRALSAASFGMAVSFLPLVLSTHWLAVGIGRLGLVALDAMWQPAFQIAQMETFGSRWRSLAYSICSMMLGLTFAIVSFGGGYLITAAGYRNLFLFGLVAATAGGIVMYSTSAGQWIAKLARE